MDTWSVAREIAVILAATALILVSIMTGLVLWQLIRLAREVRDQVKPILDSLQQTAETVRDTAGFVGGRVVSPAVTVVGAAAGARSVMQLLRQFYSSFEKRS
jgi:hypothetical protein